MAIAGQTFQVATEFILHDGMSTGLGAIEERLHGVSNAADSALTAIKGFGVNMFMSFSGLGGGLVSFLKNAVASADAYEKMQLGLSNLLATNKDFYSGAATFAERMQVSRNAIEDIVKLSRKFSLGADELGMVAKGTAQILGPQKVAGTSQELLSISADLSANFLKVIRTLPGLNAGQAQGQFGDLLTGNAANQGRFSRLLFKDAQVEFAKFGIKSAKDFNKVFKKDSAKAIMALSQAMSSLTRNSDELQGFVGLLSSKIKVIKDLLFGQLGNVFQPLGDALLGPLKMILDTVIKFIKKDFAPQIKSISRILKVLLEDPKKVLMDFMQIRNLGGDFSAAAKIGGLIEMLVLLGHLPIFSKIPLLGALSKHLVTFMGVATKGSYLVKIISHLVRFSGLIVVITVLMQAWSRAIARLKIENAGEIFNNIANYYQNLVKILKRFTAPIMEIIDGWSELFYWFLKGIQAIFGTKTAMQNFVDVAESVSEVFIKIYAGFKAFIQGLFTLFGEIAEGVLVMFNAIKSGNFAAADPRVAFAGIFDNTIKEMQDMYFETLRKNLVSIDAGDRDAPISKQQVNIGKVEIKQEFKEKQNPDRIAFTVKDQLMKVANNPTQARGRGFSTKLRGGAGVQGI